MGRPRKRNAVRPPRPSARWRSRKWVTALKRSGTSIAAMPPILAGARRRAAPAPRRHARTTASTGECAARTPAYHASEPSPTYSRHAFRWGLVLLPSLVYLLRMFKREHLGP